MINSLDKIVNYELVNIWYYFITIYNILKRYDNGGYIDDNVWYAIVSEARGKWNALWNQNSLLTAAKFIQERYGFEFSVKYLDYPEETEGGVKPIEGGEKADE